MACIPLLILPLTACTDGQGGADTTAATEAVSLPETDPATAPADTDAPGPAESDTAPAESESEAPETNSPDFTPSALPSANVARDGYALASSVKWNSSPYTFTPTYSNVHLNDGDPNTVWASEWGPNPVYDPPFDPTADHFVTVDLTRLYQVESLRLFPAIGYEGGFPEAFDVLISRDGMTFEKATSVSGASADKAKDGFVVDMGGVECRSVKLAFTKLGPGDADRGLFIALGEMEVIAPIDTASNMMLEVDDIWLFKDPDTQKQLKVDYYRDGTAVDPEKKLTYIVRDPAIAAVSEDGMLTPLTFGKTEVYVLDGQNMATCAVEVLEEPDKDEFWITTFYVVYYATPQNFVNGIDLIIKSGVEHIESVGSMDYRGNFITDYAIHLCRERGAVYSSTYRDDSYLTMTDERIVQIVSEHEGEAGYYGNFICDEPADTFTRYAEVIRTARERNPHFIYHMNLFPPAGFYTGTKEYYFETAALSDGSRRMKYLTFDQYPFTVGNLDKGIYYSLDLIRRAGLQYDCATGFYLQAQITPGAFPALELPARRYNATMAMAYGIKNYKQYLAIVSPTAAGNTSGDSGILNADEQPAVYYDDLITVNKYIKDVGHILGGAEAIEVYHTNKENASVLLPEDFFLSLTDGRNAIVTLFEEMDGSRQYIMITNKMYTRKAAAEFTFRPASDVGELSYFDPVAGETTVMALSADGTFTITLEPGACGIILLPEGVDISAPAEESPNLMLGHGMHVSSSQAQFWSAGNIASHFTTDGDRQNGAWLSKADDEAPRLILDLGAVKTVREVHLYVNDYVSKASYITDFTVAVSADGVTFTDVLTVEGATYDPMVGSVCIAAFDPVEARYIRILPKATGVVGVGEVEVYG